MNTLADSLNLGPLNGIGPLGNPSGSGIDTFAKFMSTVIGLMTIIAIIWFVFTFFSGAIGIITAGSDKQGLETSRKKIVSAVIGLVVTIAAIFIIKLVGFLLGIPNILNLGQLFNQIL